MKDCKERFQVCQDDGLQGLFWGDCKCTGQESRVEPKPEPKAEPQAEVADAGELLSDKRPENTIGPEESAREAQKEAHRETQREQPREVSKEGTPPEPSRCTPNQTRSCYTGPTGTDGKGVCKKGTQTCNAQGLWDRLCIGEVIPTQENCNGHDEDCDGQLDNNCVKGAWPARLGSGPGGPSASQSNNAVGGFAIDPKGNFYVAGKFVQTIKLDGLSHVGGWDKKIFAFKVSPEGSALKSTMAEGGSNSHTNSLVIGPKGQVYMTGYFSEKATFGSLTVNNDKGNQALFWSVATPDLKFTKVQDIGLQKNTFKSWTHGEDIAVDSQQNVLVLGRFHGTMLMGGKTYNTNDQYSFVVKHKPDGTELWSLVLSSTGSISAFSMALDKTGQLYIVGSFTGTANLGGHTLIAEGSDFFVAKIDSKGGVLWARKGGGSDDDVAYTVALDGSDQPIVGGSFIKEINYHTTKRTQTEPTPQENGFLLALDTKGNLRWLNTIWGKRSPVTAVHVDAKGAVWLSGEFEESTRFGTAATYKPAHIGKSVFVMRADPKTGRFLGLRYTELAAQATSRRILTDAKGNVYVTGTFEGKIKLGAVTLGGSGKGLPFSYIWKLPPF